MKIIAIGRNYADHIKELNSPVPEKPVFFLKPDTAIIRNNQPFFYPDFSKNIHYELEVIIKINKVGKNIAKRFAHRYFDEIGLGIDFTARDLQDECKQKGLPWEMSKSFDGSAPISNFINKTTIANLNELNFSLNLNDKPVQKGNTKDMIFSFDDIISYVSQFITLKIGDLIFTGTPVGVGSVIINDHLVARLEDKVMLDFFVK